MNKAPDAFRTISEVAEELDLPQHVLRFWESRFAHIKPLKRGGGRRYYRPEDIDLLRGIRRLLYAEGYTIKGVQRILREQGGRTVQLVGQGQEMPSAAARPQEDAHGDDGQNGSGEHGNNGRLASVDSLSQGDAAAPDEDRDEEDQEEDGQEENEGESGGPASNVPVRPQNGPIAGAATIAAAPVARLESGHAGSVRMPVHRLAVGPAAASGGAVNQAAAGRAVAGQAVVSPVMPVTVKRPIQAGVGGQDLDRLKRALAELEVCRQLLDKAIEGGW